MLFAFPLGACGNPLWDRCERLCDQVADRVEDCGASGPGFVALGSSSRREFARACRRDWVDETRGLTSRELELALDVCDGASAEVASWSCGDLEERYTASGDTGEAP